ncbi:MAG TPA: TonB-dependent receptor [Acidobacteriaceae bacterium]|nr:TonB-dependent receptor [Acidobacteriaceae bacterium]
MKRMQRSAEALLALFLLIAVFLPAPLFAQLDTGGITGTVTDPTGAVVPGATMTLTNVGTNAAQTMQSTSTGTYSFTGVRPGTYTLRAESPGFQTFIAHGLQIHVQQTATIDVHLKTGAVSQQVTVTAAAPLLQAENASVGQTITSEAVNDLPLQTRDWASLAQLSAGVTTAPVGNPSSDSGSSTSAYFSVDGVNLWQNDFRLNGINDNIEVYGGSSVGSNAAITPPPDAIQEFKLQSGDYNAEFGHSTGAVINAAIKSGTNQFHGDVWEYFRNDALNARPYFSVPSQPQPEYRQNLFGGTLGGPIIKDKTFFFADYQGGRYVTPSPATSTVPTEGMINSGFTNLQDLITGNSGTGTDALGRVFPHGTIFDPTTTRELPASGYDAITGLTGTPGAYVRDPFYTGSLYGNTNFVGDTAQLNMIPGQRLDQNAVKLLGVYPAPTSAGLNNNFTWTPKEPETTNTYDIRIDQILGPNNVLFGVYDRSLISEDVPSTLPGVAVGEGGGRHDSFPAYAFAVGYTHVFTPTFTNEMHVGMVHADKLQESNYGNTFGIPAQYGIQGIPQLPNNGGIPPTTINGFTHIGVGNYTPTLQYVWSVEGVDNVTKVFRDHTFKMGVQVDDLEGDISQPPQGRGDLNFNGQYSDIPNKNSNLTGIGDLLLTPMPSTVSAPGYPDTPNYVGGMSSFSGSNIAATDDHRWYWGAYFQDDWKATPDLTLNLGLRWDYFTPYAEVNGRQANFVAAGGNGDSGTYYISNKGCQVARSASFDALLASSNIKLDCVSDLTLGDAQETNFAPRLGFAFRALPTLVVRGGYGISYGALGNLGYGGTLGTNYPFVYVSTFNSPDSQHPLLLNNGNPATMEEAFTTINLEDPTINSGEGLNLYGRQYKFQTPYVQTVNLTVQDQFTNHDAFQVGYVATMGRHLDNLGYNNSPTEILPPSVNPQPYVPFPSFARNATYETTNASSSYNSLQTTYQHELSFGLSLLANYTYSKCLSDQHTQASQNQQYRAQWLPGFGIKQDYGLCDTDATHLVHISGSYQLPFGRGRQYMSNASRATDAVLGGWAVNFIYTYQSGQPFTVTCPVATSEFGCFADTVPDTDPYAGPHNKTQWLNPAAFAQPPIATQIGEANYAVLGGGPQQVRGPDFQNLDSSVFKNFVFTESVKLQFRAEAFNTTNTPQFAQPGQLNFTTANFSEITATRNPSEDFRRLQLALKLFF